MTRVTRAALCIGLAGATPALATEIDHRAVECVVAGSFPRVDARLTPVDTVVRARVFFRPPTGAHWYSVTMQPAGAAFAGVLPKPLKSLKAFVYYIEVTDRALGVRRTAEFTPAVVAGAGACRDKVIAGSLSAASVALEAPLGASAIPAGFASTGVASASSAPMAVAAESGATPGAGTSAASSAGMSGGLKAGLIIGAGAAAAAGVAVAASGGGSGSDESAGGGGGGGGGGGAPGGGGAAPGPSPAPGAGGAVYSVFFLPSPPGIDVSACAGRRLTWCCHNVGADSSGNFSEVWSPGEPNTLRITGTVTATTFDTTLACVSGSGTGSIQASGSGGTYQGRWSFAGQNGTVTVMRLSQ